MEQPQPVAHLRLPMSQEAEEALLGAVLLDPKAFFGVSSFLNAEDFFIKRNEHIWTAFSRLNDRGEPIDYVTLSRELEALNLLEEIGGQPYLTSLVNNTPTAVHAEIYGELVVRAATRRRMLQAADSIRATRPGRRAAHRQGHQRRRAGFVLRQRHAAQARIRAAVGRSQRLL